MMSNGNLEEEFQQIDMIQSLRDDVEEEIPLVEGGFALLNSVLVDGGDRYAVSSVAFDLREELLWMGNSGGHLTSYCGATLDKYTSFQAHSHNDIRQVLTTDDGVLALSKTHLKCNIRRGLGVFNYTSPNMVDLQCMVSYPSVSGNSPTSLVLGGYQSSLLVLDLANLKEVKHVELIEPNCLLARAKEKFLFTGDSNGKIAMRSWDTLETLQILDAHSGPLSDFDICGTKLVTCGFSSRSLGGFNCDRFLMVYDLRMLRAMAPITVTFDPFFLRFLPVYSDSRLLVASQMGNFQILEIGASTVSPFFYHVDTQGTSLLSIDVSPSKQCVAFGDGAGFIHLFSDRATPVFNESSRPTEFADAITPLPPISFSDTSTPLSLIPMLLKPQADHFLSDLPPSMMKRVYRVPEPIDPATLQNMKMSGPVGYAPRPANKRFPNVVPYDLKSNSTTTLRSRSPLWKDRSRPNSDLLTDSTDGSLVPPTYRKICLRYGRDEPDYKTYNQTKFSVLEPVSPNSYINVLFQVFYHMEPLRKALLSHLCRRDSCLSCEVAFVFHMLQTAENTQACSAGNFLRAFRTMPEAIALGLVLNERGDKKSNLAGLIQGANLFLLRKLHSELSNVDQGANTSVEEKDSGSKMDKLVAESGEESSDKSTVEKNVLEKSSSVIERLFASSISYLSRCKCGNESARGDKSMIITLPGSLKGTAPENFVSVLEKSFSLDQVIQMTCDQCSKLQTSIRSRRTEALPDILIINCPIETEKRFLPTSQQNIASTVTSVEKLCRFGTNCVRVDCFYSHPERSPSPASLTSIKHTKVEAQVSSGDQTLPAAISLNMQSDGFVKIGVAKIDNKIDGHEDSVYDLYAVVELIQEQNDQHLVASVKTQAGWILFNDYCVTPIPAKDVTTFDLAWKIPCLLHFAKRDYVDHYKDIVYHNPIDERVLTETNQSVAMIKRLPSMNCVPLDMDEIPKRGCRVALDAEFVTLNEEEAELHSNGTKLTIKPSQMSPARVTVIRTSGPLEGIPFIDDYIATQEEVVNYLTKFSGIKPGDLDPLSTNKHLTTLKTTYVKLRYLVDNGVIFIGHGLANDFKVLNLLVPANQMIDTVQLFRLPNRRMISLRFLAWHFLGLEIQADTHDSVEDARTALKLYKKYDELVSSKGVAHFTRTMADVYEKGRNLQWQISSEGQKTRFR